MDLCKRILGRITTFVWFGSWRANWVLLDPTVYLMGQLGSPDCNPDLYKPRPIPQISRSGSGCWVGCALPGLVITHKTKDKFHHK